MFNKYILPFPQTTKKENLLLNRTIFLLSRRLRLICLEKKNTGQFKDEDFFTVTRRLRAASSRSLSCNA